MQPVFENKTVLTEDLYMSGIKEYYKIGHRFSRSLAVAYAVVMLGFAGIFLYDLNIVLGIPFLLASVLILFWQFKGYLISAKKSFKSFAVLHQSHYEVDMEYIFYDKRLEQLQTHGTRFQEAAVCDSWVRFENQIRGKYAHSITSELMKMESPEQLETMIAACITNKYTFIATDGTEASVTTALKKLTPTASYEFRLPKYRDMSLTESLHFLTTHAGLLPFLYKASLFNPNAIDEFSDYLKARMSTYIPNHDVTKWVKEHSDYYSVHGLEDLFETGGKENDS